MTIASCLSKIIRIVLTILFFSGTNLQAETSINELESQLKQLANKDQKLDYLLSKKDTLEQWNPTERGKYFLLLGLQQEEFSDWTQAEKSYTGAIVNLKINPVSVDLVESYLNRSYMQYIKTNDKNVYCEDRHSALFYARKLNNPEYLAKSLTSVSFCFADSEQFQKGLELLDEAASIATDHSLSVRRRAMIYNASANLYRDNQIVVRADEYYEKAYLLWKGTDDWQDMFNILHSMVSTKISMARLDNAQQHVNSLFKLANSKPKFKDFHFFAQYNAGTLEYAKKNYEKAIFHFQKTLSLSDTTSEVFFINKARARLALAYLRNGKKEKASQFAAIYLKNLTGRNKKDDLFFKMQAAIFFQKGENIKTIQSLFSAMDFIFQQKYAFIKNSSLSNSLNHDASIMKLEAQVLTQQLKIKGLALTAEKDKQQMSKQMIIIVTLVAFALFTAVIFLLQSRRYFKRRSQTDFLTQIANRRFSFEEGAKLLSKARKQQRHFSVIIFDIDKFKLINDQHGHEVGDKAIQATISQAKHCLRKNDVLGRIGGEEFLILLPDTQLEKSMEIAQRLREKIDNKIFQFKELEISFTISAGIATLKDGINNIDELVKEADDALYRAKENGRNQCQSA